MIQGTVAVVNKNNGGFYALCIDDKWYGCGKAVPHGADGSEITKGDAVEFDTSRNGAYENVVESTLRKVMTTPTQAEGAGGAPTASVPAKSTTSAAGGSYNKTQETIQFQAARNTAITGLNFLLDQELIPTFKGAKGTHVDQYFNLLMDITLRLNAETKALGPVNMDGGEVSQGGDDV